MLFLPCDLLFSTFGGVIDINEDEIRNGQLWHSVWYVYIKILVLVLVLYDLCACAVNCLLCKNRKFIQKILMV